MERKTKDLIFIYICFALLAVGLAIWGITLKSCKDQMAQPQEAVQKQQTEAPIVYDKPMENPAARVEIVQQLPEFPSGDEFAAAASLLNAYGYNVDIYSLLDTMNYNEENFVLCYVGDARTDTGYCFAGSLVICMNNYLAQNDVAIYTQNFTDMTFEELKEYVSSGKPLIVWFTNDYQLPRFNGQIYNDHFQMYENAHCVVVYDVQNGVVSFADSLVEENSGKIGIAEDEFRQIWEACGSQAIGVYYPN